MSGTTTRRAIGQSVSFGPKLRTALNDVLGGGAASVLTVTFGLSYSLLIFAGPLAPYLSYGVAATFIASAILAFVIALGSSLPFAVAGPESSTAAVTAILPSSLVDRMALAGTPIPGIAPVLITLGLSTIITGLVLCGFGVTRMGRAIRYVPYPVVGGFLGAGGSLRHGPRPLSDLAPLPQHVRTASYPYRRHRLRARCVLVCRHLTGRRA